MKAKHPIYRVRFVEDAGAQFEECNGESCPLTEEEYADNRYMGCPDHPRAGSIPDPCHPGTSLGLCARVDCRKPLAPIPYEEYRAYYGNPKMHVYLGVVADRLCPHCGNWEEGVSSVWGVDFMVDSRELDSFTLDDPIAAEIAVQLPGYAGELAREELIDAGWKPKRRSRPRT